MKIACLLSLTTAAVISISNALAAPIESIESALAKPSLQKVDSFLSEQSVTDQLGKLGVTPAQAQARLAKLDDAQLAQLAAHVDKINAGGDIVGGYPHPLGPIGCIFARIGDTITHVFKVLFCWTDIN
ncbi:MAG: PA2779 family protein [Verrucomicrobiota bacterium]